VAETVVQYRQATRDDLNAVARIFLAAFPESIAHYVGHPIPPNVLSDVFAICLDAEPEAFLVAGVDSAVAGYVFAPAHFSRLFRTAVLRGHLFRLAGHWLSGRYGFGLRPVRIALRNWTALWRERNGADVPGEARILSIAVDPSRQNLGIGSGLLARALDYLHAQGVPSVRLEVRPENPSAKHLYEKYGFEIKGTTQDTQGSWLIMLKTF
jgi:ribosomal protein S18 acetylase RimI-like enzyme